MGENEGWNLIGGRPCGLVLAAECADGRAVGMGKHDCIEPVQRFRYDPYVHLNKFGIFGSDRWSRVGQ